MDTETRWWFGADRKWHQGEPPGGWWQATDRRWYPPEETPDGHPITTGPRHMAPGHDPYGPATDDGSFDGSRPWADIGIPVALAALLLAVVVIGILWVRSFSTIGNDGGLDAEPAHDPLVTAPSSPAMPEAPEAEASAVTDQLPVDAGESAESDGSTAETTVQQPTAEGSAVDEADPPPAARDQRDDSPETGGRSDDCPGWTPPGRPDHPVAPGRADRDHCD
jgi:hypothetical protein